MKVKRPFGITFIGYFYILGGIVLLLTLGVEQEIGMNIRFGIPYIPEIIVRITVAIFSLIMAYGYLDMKTWGYWTMIIYSLMFLFISFNQIAVYNSQPFIGNAVFSLIVLFYTFTHRHYFNGKVKISSNRIP